MYDYNRTAAKKTPKRTEKEPAERVLTQEAEVEKAIQALHAAIEALHDCAPSGRDFQEDGEFDSKGYNKAVAKHGTRIDQLHAMITDLTEAKARLG